MPQPAAGTPSLLLFRRPTWGWLLISFFSLHCATPQTTVHALGRQPPLCADQDTVQQSLVFWGSAWRANQKEPTLREEIARKAISAYFGGRSCLHAVGIVENVSERSALELSDAELLLQARSYGRPIDQIVVLRIEELGPILILRPCLLSWEGGSDLRLRVRTIDVQSERLTSDISYDRRESGTYVVRGVGPLAEQLELGLQEVFEGTR
ncbi:MAG: hypothetical protein K1X75_14265 [Leptospirales bacterium]|nr:hypothetical protein [Leptospirales bacterium]